MEKIKVTLKGSLIAAKPVTKKTAESLGLKRQGDSVILPDDAASAGKIRLLAHLVAVEKAEG